MKTAFKEISDLLEEKGVDTDTIDELLGRFLEEEAFDYVRAMDQLAINIIEKERSENNNNLA